MGDDMSKGRSAHPRQHEAGPAVRFNGSLRSRIRSDRRQAFRRRGHVDRRQALFDLVGKGGGKLVIVASRFCDD